MHDIYTCYRLVAHDYTHCQCTDDDIANAAFREMADESVLHADYDIRQIRSSIVDVSAVRHLMRRHLDS